MKTNNLKLNTKRLLDNYGIIFVFILLCIILFIATPNFLISKNLINVLRQISINGLLSFGMTFVILTGGIDLSVGSILAFSGVVAASLSSTTNGGTIHSPIIVIIVSVLAGIAFGATNGFLVAYLRMPPFVVTLGMLGLARGLTYIYTDGTPIPQLDESFLQIGQGAILKIPYPVIILSIMFILLFVLLNHTKYGRYVYAVGGNINSAWVSGVNVKLILLTVYIISGIMSALGGVIITARTTAGLPQAGQAYELDAIAAVVIGGSNLKGGKGSLVGTVFGVLIIGVINNGLNLLGVSSYFQQVIKGGIIIFAVMLDSIRNKN